MNRRATIRDLGDHIRSAGWIALVATIVFSLSALLSGCAKSNDPESPGVATGTTGTSAQGPGRLTQEQAAALSQVLFKNFDAGGATIDALIPYNTVVTFRVKAEVDWKQSRGRGTLESTFTDNRPTENQGLAWTDKQTALTDSGGQWQQRLLDPKKYPLDQVLALINGLASEQRENPALIRQGPSQFLRRDLVGATPVDVYKYGERTTWFVDDSGSLLRVEAAIASLANPAIIDLRDRGNRFVALP